jgi:phage tail sheath gpL-like
VNLSVCIIAQKLATGTAVQNKPIQVFSTGDVTGQAGAGSQAEAMARAALTTNRNMELFFVYQDDSGTGVAATGTLTFSGTASVTASGVGYIGDQRVEVLVNNGDDQDAVALATDAAITAAQDRLLLSSTSATNVTTLVARNKGTSGNEIPVALDFSAVTGISVVTVQPTSGANDPVLQDALDSLDGTNIGFIVIQHNDATALTTLENHIRAQSEPTVGQRFKAFAGLSLVDVGTAASRATNVDYERISIGYSRNTATAARTKYTPAQIAAVYGATYTKTSDPALPRNGDVLIGMPVPDFDDLLSFSEANTLLKNGIAVLSTQGNNSVIMRSVSTKTTTNSVTDFTLLDLQITDSLDYFATAVESTLSIQFRKTKITDRVKKAIKSSILAVSYLLEIDEIVRDVAENQSGIIITEDTTNNGQLNITIPAEIVQGLHVISQDIVLIVNPGGNN